MISYRASKTPPQARRNKESHAHTAASGELRAVLDKRPFSWQQAECHFRDGPMSGGASRRHARCVQPRHRLMVWQYVVLAFVCKEKSGCTLLRFTLVLFGPERRRQRHVELFFSHTALCWCMCGGSPNLSIPTNKRRCLKCTIKSVAAVLSSQTV